MINRFLIIVLFLVAALIGSGNRVVNRAGGGGGGSPVSFADDFNRTDSDSLGANWTEADGDIDIFSNTMRLAGGSFVDHFAIYSGAACTTISQYVLFTYHTEGGYPEIALRYTNSSSPFYYVSFSNTTVDWNHTTQIGGTDSQINASSGSISLSSGTVIGITITGTGSSTEVNVWINPPGGYDPSDPFSWGAADVTFTDNPASPVDTGAYVGLGGAQGSANTVRYDLFYGGDIP